MFCPECESSLGCAVDCSNAPWNFDKPVLGVPKKALLKRLVRWVRECIGSYSEGGPLGFTQSELTWRRGDK